MPSTTRNLLAILGIISVIMGVLVVIETSNIISDFLSIPLIALGIISLSMAFGAI